MVRRHRQTNIVLRSVRTGSDRSTAAAVLIWVDVCYKPFDLMSEAQREKKKEYFVKGWGTVCLPRHATHSYPAR